MVLTSFSGVLMSFHLLKTSELTSAAVAAGPKSPLTIVLALWLYKKYAVNGRLGAFGSRSLRSFFGLLSSIMPFLPSLISAPGAKREFIDMSSSPFGADRELDWTPASRRMSLVWAI